MTWLMKSNNISVSHVGVYNWIKAHGESIELLRSERYIFDQNSRVKNNKILIYTAMLLMLKWNGQSDAILS